MQSFTSGQCRVDLWIHLHALVDLLKCAVDLWIPLKLKFTTFKLVVCLLNQHSRCITGWHARVVAFFARRVHVVRRVEIAQTLRRVRELLRHCIVIQHFAQLAWTMRQLLRINWVYDLHNAWKRISTVNGPIWLFRSYSWLIAAFQDACLTNFSLAWAHVVCVVVGEAAFAPTLNRVNIR